MISKAYSKTSTVARINTQPIIIIIYNENKYLANNCKKKL